MIYLASSSPRRRKLLRDAGYTYRIIRPDYHEKKIPGVSPERLTRTHAIGKALSASRKVGQGLILAADTIVWFRGQILGKPSSMAHARRMLGMLGGKWHRVVTGVALLKMKDGRTEKKQVFTVSTRVLLRHLEGPKLDAYLKRIRPLDKAGSYAIQSSRDSLVERWVGSHSNAVGLPMEELKKSLRMLR